MQIFSKFAFQHRHVCLCLFCFIFLGFWFYDKATFDQQFRQYEKEHQNPQCPALNKTLWKTYKKLISTNVVITQEEKSNLTINDLRLAAFMSKTHLSEALDNCASVMNHPELKSLPFTMFFTPDVDRHSILIYKKFCPHVAFIPFPFKKLPDDVQHLVHYRFKAIYQALALRNNKLLLTFDTSVVFNKAANFSRLIESSLKNNYLDVTLLSPAYHNMFSTIHPGTYNCFPKVASNKMIDMPQYKSGFILWVASEIGWKTMKRYVECSLHPSCIAPPGSTKDCIIKNITENPSQFSGCHRFDQSVLNLILYENSNCRPQLFQHSSNSFTIKRLAQL